MEEKVVNVCCYGSKVIEIKFIEEFVESILVDIVRKFRFDEVK